MPDACRHYRLRPPFPAPADYPQTWVEVSPRNAVTRRIDYRHGCEPQAIDIAYMEENSEAFAIYRCHVDVPCLFYNDFPTPDRFAQWSAADGRCIDPVAAEAFEELFASANRDPFPLVRGPGAD